MNDVVWGDVEQNGAPHPQSRSSLDMSVYRKAKRNILLNSKYCVSAPYYIKSVFIITKDQYFSRSSDLSAHPQGQMWAFRRLSLSRPTRSAVKFNGVRLRGSASLEICCNLTPPQSLLLFSEPDGQSRKKGSCRPTGWPWPKLLAVFC